ncbi:MAG: hypothetical protein JNL11_03845 [Bdellovibrionaceae bacterium]|nr:hypothetical protein [Pseudobdellovibrionaceae bacterium]
MNIKIHFRRCHYCNETNECVGDIVTSCGMCGKRLLPFLYFDERIEFGFSKLSKAKKKKLKSKLPYSTYPPLIGVSSVWETD